MSFLWNLLFVLLRAFLPALMERKPDTMEDATTQPVLRDQLRSRVRNTWGRTAGVVALLCMTCLCSGCWFQQVRTVYIPHGEPVRIRETIRNAKVWTMGADGQPVAGTMDIPEGWYALPMDAVESPQTIGGAVANPLTKQVAP